MKKLIIILTCLTTFQLFAEKEIELSPIVLPYDSLNIDEVYGYGATIIARSGNTIYHTTDDGGNWGIALESETKLNQLYSKDPHTVFAIGDSGLVYRTMDYGASWVDVSVDTDLELRAMAAGNYSEYMIITPRRFQFRVKDLGDYETTITNENDVELFSIVKNNDSYLFGGSYTLDEFTDRNVDWAEFYVPIFKYDGQKTTKSNIDRKGSLQRKFNNYSSDSLLIFQLDQKLYCSLVNRGVGGVMLNKDHLEAFDFIFGGIHLQNERAVFITQNDSTINIITREGTLVQNSINNFETQNNINDLPHYDLGVSPINNVHKIGADDYYIASNNSTIYRTKLVKVSTSVELEADNAVSLYSDVIEFNNGAKLVYATNYLGQKLNYSTLATNIYKLEKGLSFITYLDTENNMKTIKIVVNK